MPQLYYATVSGSTPIPSRSTDEVTDWQFDWSAQMAQDSDTLSASVFRTERVSRVGDVLHMGDGIKRFMPLTGGSLVVPNKELDPINHTTKVWLWALEPGRYRVENVVQTTAGRVHERSIVLDVVDPDRTSGELVV